MLNLRTGNSCLVNGQQEELFQTMVQKSSYVRALNPLTQESV